MASGISEKVAARVENARKDLLDLTLRNPILNYRLPRARGVDAVGESAADVFDSLVKAGSKVSFMPKPEEGEPQRRGRSSRRTARLRTDETASALHARLLRTYTLARTSIEEQGVNTLFFALGMVEWHQADASDTPRRAPLILVPVSLQRGDVNADFLAEYDDGEIGANLSFIEKARYDFGIDIPNIPEDADADELDAAAYFGAVSGAIANMPRWSVDETAVALGFFSFQKLLMYRDLDPREWGANGDGGGANGGGRVINAIFGGGGFSDPGPSVGENERLDDRLQPADIHHVMDADSSQAVVVADVANGRDLVVQGPPGTGKSQTIVNLIADAIGGGKTVLFVSEKMAALEVVKRRLDEIGIGDACLELHSHKTSKRALLDELKRTTDLNRPKMDGVEEDLESLTKTRDALNRYADAVNAPIGETGVTPHEAMGFLAGLAQSGDDEFPDVRIAGVDEWTRADFRVKRDVIERLQLRLSQTGPPSEHVFRGVRASIPLTPMSHNRLERAMRAAADSLERLVEESESLRVDLRLPSPFQASDVDRLVAAANSVVENRELAALNLDSDVWWDDAKRGDLDAFISASIQYNDIRARYDGVLTNMAWSESPNELRRMKDALQNARRGIFGMFASREFKNALQYVKDLWITERLPSDESEWIAALDALIEARGLLDKTSALKATAESALGGLWRGDSASDPNDAASKSRAYIALLDRIRDGRTPAEVVHALKETAQTNGFDALSETAGDAANALKSHKAAVAAILDALDMDSETRFGTSDGLASLPFAEQREILDKWLNDLPSLDHIIGLNIGLKQARDEGLDALADLALTWQDAPKSLTALLERIRHESILERAYAERPDLAAFDSAIHGDAISRFISQDKRSLAINRARVAYRHHEGLPFASGGGEVAILRREFEKRRRHLPIRKLIESAGGAIQAIKPVFMMSPLSIANYIPPGTLNFDVVIFDEASQVRPVDALGAMMRGDQMVVVGDTEQLPPTSFFDKVAEGDDDGDEEDSAVGDMESILGTCRAEGMPVATLRWHYRSRHDSLIALSNREFYDNGLVVFASPDFDRADSGLKFRHLAGTVYERGGINRGEAKYVAQAVMERAQTDPDMTLGVAAFSAKQANAIQDELETLRRQDPSRESFFAAHPHEPFFVKNLENVQGDERDVIFISVGYGRDATGQVRMNFGPLNKEGGHRRLNVLITRARRRCEVFTNLRADDIALDRTKARGVQAFKAFLQYAETGILPVDTAVESGVDFGSPFQKALANSIRERGYEVHEEVASGGRFIDIAVVDPNRRGRYALGVEFDGAAYHSARWARDRDRLRDQVLEGLGWRIHRVWSTDYFRDPKRELDKVEEAILRSVAESAQDAAAVSPSPSASIAPKTEPEPEPPPRAPAIEREDAPTEPDDGAIAEYETASPTIELGWYELHEIPRGRLHDAIAEIARVEGPVHQDEIARRIAAAAGVGRIGRRIKETVNAEIAGAARRGRVARRGEFAWDPEMETPTIRDRSNLPAQQKKLELIAPEEIDEALLTAVRRAFGIGADDAISEAAGLLGFARTSAGMGETIRARVRDLLKRGALVADGDMLRIGD